MIYYLSGKVTNNPNYMSEFAYAEEEIKERFGGHRGPVEVINPAKILESVSRILSYDDCMDICFKLIDCADVVFMLDNWHESKGACMERGYAIAKGITVKARC